jgi:hypothetical protein
MVRPFVGFVSGRCGSALRSGAIAAEQAQWTRRQEARLSPVAYYLLTLTAPAEMRGVFLHYPVEMVLLFLCSYCQFAKGVGRPQKVPRREHRLHSDPTHLYPANALSSPHPCARPGSGSRSKRLRA